MTLKGDSANVPPEPLVPLVAAEQEAVRLEQAGAYEAALALCERILSENEFDPLDAAALRAEAQFSQRRLRLRRKLGLPTWSSQGASF